MYSNNYLISSEKINMAWNYVTKRLFNPKTNLIYDHAIADESDLPTVKETSNLFPNPCGYGTNMEDCMIHAGTMLDACIRKFEKENSSEASDFAHKLICGMLNCASSAKSVGFIPRGIIPSDCKSHYPDSSRDQYTLFVFGMHRYINSKLCTADEKKQITNILVSIAVRAEKNVVPKTDYDMLCDDGKPTLVNKMWGSSLGNHEVGRLTMIYLAAWEVSKDTHWLDMYHGIREEAYEKSLPMTNYWHLYALQQMQTSLCVLYDAEPDLQWKEKYRSLMNTVAQYALNMSPIVGKKLDECTNCNEPYISFRKKPFAPQENYAKMGIKCTSPIYSDTEDFFCLQDAANIIIVSSLAPDTALTDTALEVYKKAFDKIDLSKHTRATPVHFLSAYYLSK